MSDTMTLARALRYKKRVVETIRSLEADIHANNTRAEGEEREVDVVQALAKRDTWVKHLIELKLEIQEKTKPIQRLVLSLAEAKAKIAFLARLTTTTGTVRPSYRDEAAVKYDSVIRKVDKDKQTEELQKMIDDLQTKIDAHNAETKIEVVLPPS